MTPTLAQTGEWGLLKRLLPRLPGARDKRLLVGPGDDAAVFRGRPGTAAWALTTDMLVEGVHFDLRWTSPEDLGWKALAVNLSDLAAMGPVRPSLGVVALGLPPRTPSAFVDGFYRGLGRLARRHAFSVAGGDTVRSEKIVVSLAVLGEVPRGARVLRRSGARPGDVLMATGTLGDAAAGLEIVKRQAGSGKRKYMNPLKSLRLPPPGSRFPAFLVRRLLRPEPRLDLARRISSIPGVTAMMDSSDGLWRSAAILAEASGVGMRLALEKIPLSPALRPWSPRARASALVGGEDYELVLTARPAAARRLEKLGYARPVGRVESIGGVRVFSDGHPRSVPHGFEHFG